MKQRFFQPRWILGFAALCLSAPPAPAKGAEAVARTGLEIYRADCARCHGPKGEGVADKHDEPLYGDKSVEALARIIHRTMPEDTDEKTSEAESALVAAYLHEEFYSPEARARMQPARIQLSRLTARQYENAVADLIGTFRGQELAGDERGLNAQYYNSSDFKQDKKAIERVDPQIHFDVGAGSPNAEKIGAEEFSIRWRGSLIADETGDYEFALKTENGARLRLNAGEPVIDAWVSTGSVREERATVRLLGGRAYPIRVDLFKFKDKTASLSLLWKPPHKVWAPVPERNLSPKNVPETLVVTTLFPPDDSSSGYERGIAVSKAWDQAATRAATETAAYVVTELDSLAGTKAGAADRKEKLIDFCARFAERAFRRPLTPEQRKFFIENQFECASDLDAAVKRVVVLALKSPRFLFPQLEAAPADDYDTASRLSFTFWDTLPDKELMEAAGKGELKTREQIAAQAKRMLKDPRSRAKLRSFFHEWLEMEEAEDMSKDMAAFPGFGDELMADLRTSLDMFIDQVVWSEASDYRQLLLANHLYLNKRLADFYGVEFPGGEGFQKVAFDAKQRSGVITHPFLLSTFAYHRNTSPIHRGVFLTRNIVGRSLKPPPMAIEFMDGRFDPSLTMREKVTELTSPSACQGCHSVINPLGFSLEHYDAVGRFRTEDNKKPVDAASDYPSLDGKTVRITGARDVAQLAASSPEAQLAFIRQLFHHLAKQPPEAYGAATLETLRKSFAAADYNIQKLAIEIVALAALQPAPPSGTASAETPAPGNKS